MLDPLVFRLISMLFALLLITAAVNKLGNRQQFQGIVANYQLLPVGLTGLASVLIPLTEIVLGLGWVLAWRIDLIATATVSLLAVYALAMGLNLARGRTYIDCGCGMQAGKAGSSASSEQQLSLWLVLRNIVLILMAAVAATGVGQRSIVLVDYFSIIVATLALVILYGAFHQLLLNNNAIASWRKPLLVKIKDEARHD